MNASANGNCQWSPDSSKWAMIGRGPVNFGPRMPGKGEPGIYLQVWEVRYPSRTYAPDGKDR